MKMNLLQACWLLLGTRRMRSVSVMVHWTLGCLGWSSALSYLPLELSEPMEDGQDYFLSCPGSPNVVTTSGGVEEL